MIMKICGNCKEKKPIEDFYLTHHGKHRMSECKKCSRKRTSSRYYANKKMCLEYKQQWVEKNREKYNKSHSDYQKRNPEKTNLMILINYWKKKTGIEFEKFKYGTATIDQMKKRIEFLKKNKPKTKNPGGEE
jgi:hypothetical protein